MPDTLKTGLVTSISYLKEDDETLRTIIPTSVPTNIKALDVTGLEEPVQQQVAESYQEYAEYLKLHMKQAYSFEDWLEHTKGLELDLKWRTFKPEKTKVL